MRNTLNKLIVGISLIVASTSGWAAMKTSVMVRPTSDVAAAQVMLGEIATVQCTDSSVADKYRVVPICPSPLAGKTRTISRDQIIIAMRRQGIRDDSSDLLCPSEVSVTRTSSTITGQAIFDAVKEYATKSGSWPGSVSIEPVRLPTDQQAPAGKLELRVKPTMQKLGKGRNSLPIEVVVDEKVYATVNVSFVARLFANVLVASQPIARSTELTPANVSTEEREITNLPDDILTVLPADGMVATASIAQGAPIRASCASQAPVIRSGDSVVVLVSVGGVKVSDKGTAVSDGRTGDRIKVRLLGDVREVRGTVTAPGLVEINIGRRNS